MFQKLRQLNTVETVLVVFLALVALICAYRVVVAFYDQHAEMLPAEGGTYIEGAVGKVGTLNPLLAQQGSITHDITQLIFSGLTKYDPETREMVADLADYTVSENGKEYTFVIKERAVWHDGKPVTSNDVLFTYESVIKNPSFKGVVLNYNDYSGMKLSKVDERTVQFLLEKPDSFFLVKTMTGLLPEHLLANVPVTLIGDSPFSLEPVGTGGYRFVSMLPVNNHMEVSLEAFDD
ncbi:MAG: ABC transporter substrate-binding protein, partial [Candidatus Peregrinibacteria bacterium]